MQTSYYWSTNSAYVTPPVYLPQLPYEQTTWAPVSGNLTELTSATLEYDNYGSDSRHAGLTLDAGIVQMDGPCSNGTVTARGNATMVTLGLWADASVTSHEYDVAGNVVQSEDGNGNAATVTYAPSYYATPALPAAPCWSVSGTTECEPPAAGSPVPFAAPTPGNTYAFATTITNALGQHTTFCWDENIGKPTVIKDPNDKPTYAYYADAGSLDRLTSVTRPDGGSTAYTYLDASNKITTTVAVTGSADAANCAAGISQVSDLIYDGLGRKWQEIRHEAAGPAEAQTNYDSMGRAYEVTNPSYNSMSSAITTTLYDALGRTLSVTAPDGAATRYTYAGNRVTETAPDYQSPGSTTATTVTVRDALGRLTGVTDAAGTLTSYAYDGLGDLLSVTQPSVWRSFSYDSLKRLKTAVNPESGTLSYTYDANGNLLTRKDAAGRVTCFGALSGTTCAQGSTPGYDALNRALNKTYSDGTPAVSFTWDSPFIGAPSTVRNSVSTTTYNAYDAMGRPTQMTQTTGGSYVSSYGWNLAGGIEKLTYPSGRVVATF